MTRLVHVSQALRAVWIMRSRSSQLSFMPKLQLRYLGLAERWGVIYRLLEAARVKALPRVSELESEMQVGDRVIGEFKSAVRIRAAYRNRFGEWEPARFIDGHRVAVDDAREYWK